MLECAHHAHMVPCCANFQIYDKTNFPFFLLSTPGTQQAHTIWHHHAFLLQQHNIYYTSSGPIAKVSNVKRENRKVKEKKGE